MSKKRSIDMEYVRRLYLIEKKTITEICVMLDYKAAKRLAERMRQADIPIRPRNYRCGKLHTEETKKKMQKSAIERYKRVPSEKLDIVCKHCKATFKGYKHRKFCSDICSRQWHKGDNHPKGGGRMKGFKHADETKEKISKANVGKKPSKEALANLRKGNTPEKRLQAVKTRRANGGYKAHNTYSRCKRGKRADLDNVFFRSSWEANVARYLNFLVKKGEILRWEYEPDTFWFEGIRRGVLSYTPDFKVFTSEESYEWWEVKGWMDAKSKTRLRRMAKYYPDEKIIVIAKKEYTALKDFARLIENWE